MARYLEFSERRGRFVKVIDAIDISVLDELAGWANNFRRTLQTLQTGIVREDF